MNSDWGLDMNENFDRMGTVASSLCAVHCAICAFLPAIFSGLGGFLIGHTAEWVFTLVAVALALVALVLGFRKHRSSKVAGLLGLGILGLLTARVIEMNTEQGCAHHDHGETVSLLGPGVGILAGVILLFGHVMNIRRSRECKEECCP